MHFHFRERNDHIVDVRSRERNCLVTFVLINCRLLSLYWGVGLLGTPAVPLCRQKNSYAMRTIKITPNLLFEHQCTSGKFIRLPNRIESNRNFFARIGML